MHVCLSLWAWVWVCCVCVCVCSVLMVATEELVPEAKGPHAVGSFLLFLQGLHEIWHLQIWTKQHYLLHGGNDPKVLREMLAFRQADYCWTQRRTIFFRMLWKSLCENPSWAPHPLDPLWLWVLCFRGRRHKTVLETEPPPPVWAQSTQAKSQDCVFSYFQD